MNDINCYKHRVLQYESSLDEVIERTHREAPGYEMLGCGDPLHCNYRWAKLKRIRRKLK